MSDVLRKLGSIGSPPLARQPATIHLPDFDSFGQRAEELLSMLRLKNGFYAFESALHVFPAAHFEGEMTLSQWNSPGLWRHEYQDLAEGCLFFAEDIFGNQFCIRDGQIGSFDAETGVVDHLTGTLEEWAGLILKDYDLHTAYRVAHHWQKEHGPVSIGKRLMLKRPLVLGGDYSLTNLFAVEAVEGMRLRGNIAKQIDGLPEGTHVDFRFTD
jgi:hypothetical protein